LAINLPVATTVAENAGGVSGGSSSNK